MVLLHVPEMLWHGQALPPSANATGRLSEHRDALQFKWGAAAGFEVVQAQSRMAARPRPAATPPLPIQNMPKPFVEGDASEIVSVIGAVLLLCGCGVRPSAF